MQAHIVKQPVVSEKSLQLAAGANQFSFVVDRRANKNQIKEAIEQMYDVKVVAVNTVTGHRVRKSTGKKRMKTVIAPTKKAMVTLKEGQTIPVFDFGESQAS